MHNILNKQGFNGHLGEQRTAAILAKDFLVSTISVDIEGRDFTVEEMPSSLIEIQESKKRITCKGIVQAKYFENSNEVKIARHYVEDTEGVKTDFFALIHTDDINRNEHVYFFTAREIQQNFTLRTDSDKDYYIFRLSSKRKFLKYKNIPSHKINQVIRNEISRTEEFRNEEFIRRITEKWVNPINEQQYSNNDLFKSLKGKHIVDKLYIVLNTYNDFRRVHGWRLGEKVSFYDKINTHTYYHNFALRTNNQQIIDFFSNIKIAKTVGIKNMSYFNGVSNVIEKINDIVKKLNEGNITVLEAGTNKIDIKLKQTKPCGCSICHYRSLNFCESASSAFKKDSENGWDLIQNAFSLFSMGKYGQARILFNQAHEDAVSNKEFVLSFICRYNLNIVSQYIPEQNSANLYFELLKLDIPAEKKEILKFVSEHTMLNSYLNQIDNNYLKIKDYQQRQVNNSTFDLINSQRIKIIECLNFYRGNRFLLTEEFDQLFEKHIESCIISYSMRCSYRRHLNSFDDFIIELILLYCDPQKLITYFQRNNVYDVPYISENNNYFPSALLNFFSDKNIAYLKNEISAVEGKIKNYDLRRKTVRIFNNICIVLSHVETDFHEQLAGKIIKFVKELDLSLDEYSFLAHPIFQKASFFSSADLLELIGIILAKNDHKGYLLTNCLFALRDKKCFIEKNNQEIIDQITEIIIDAPHFQTLRSFSKILRPSELEKLKLRINSSLTTEFNFELYHEAIICACLNNYLEFTKVCSDKINAIINRKNPVFLEQTSTVTGLSSYIASRLGNLVEIIYAVGEKAVDKKTLSAIKKVHPYYKFLLEIENYRQGNPFDLSWLIENRSNIVLERLASSDALKLEVRKKINTSSNKNILNIYFQYFAN